MKKSKGGKKPLPKKAKAPVKKTTAPPKKSNPKKSFPRIRTISDLDTLRGELKKAMEKMNAAKQKALLALAAAATAVAAAAAALAQDDDGTPAPTGTPAASEAAPKPAAKPKAVKVDPCKAAVTGPNTSTPRVCIKPMPHGPNEHEFPPEGAVTAPPAKAATAAAAPAEKSMFDQVVDAFKEYCGIYTRENGVKLLKEYMPEGNVKPTLADVPEDKLPELLAKLKA